jgi:myo-inositol 2-dehydrogenase/D-chiro-inositol 1-dehydrogenase
VAHIGNISMRLGRKLQWSPDTERFVEDDEANAMLTRKQRDPWTIANIDSWL